MCLERRVRELEECFARIGRERMRGLPFLNKGLRVEAVDFMPWHGDYLGVLIAPWFMNIMLLHGSKGELEQLPTGEKATHGFPSGVYEFTAGEEPGAGRYRMCSLFSPVLEFTDQEAAVATAQAVMQGLMDENNRDETSMRSHEVERIWRGDGKMGQDESGGDAVLEPGPTLSERFAQPISRRALLKGQFLGDRE